MPKGAALLPFLAIVLIAMTLASCGGELVVLLPDENGRVGALTVGEDEKMVVLDAPLAAAEIDASGQAQKDVVSQKKVDRIFAGALSAEPPASVVFTFKYDLGSTVVLEESKPELEALFNEVAKREAVEVEITGHTDRVGSIAENDRLSLQRARMIQKMLVDRGLKSHFIRAVGRGEREPLVETRDEAAESRNRRVVVVVR